MLIDKDRIAILYETITGQCQKRGVISVDGPETFDLSEFLRRHPKLAAVVVPRAQLPGAEKNEPFFREVIARETGTPFFAHGADRCVMVDAQGVVVSVHNGNVPGLDFPHDGHTLVDHLTADVGHIVGRK